VDIGFGWLRVAAGPLMRRANGTLARTLDSGKFYGFWQTEMNRGTTRNETCVGIAAQARQPKASLSGECGILKFNLAQGGRIMTLFDGRGGILPGEGA